MSAVAMALSIRRARAADAARLAAIWNHEALTAFTTTDTEPRDLAAQRAWLAQHSVMARITAGNLASRRLHEALGFRLVGVEEEVALKLGRWLDVALYQRRL